MGHSADSLDSILQVHYHVSLKPRCVEVVEYNIKLWRVERKPRVWSRNNEDILSHSIAVTVGILFMNYVLI